MKKLITIIKNLFNFPLLLILLALFILTPLVAQTPRSTKLRVGILPVANNTELAYIDTLTETVQNDIFFTATQVGRFTVIDGRSIKLTNSTHLARLRRIAASKRCHYLIAGEITQGGGAYTLTLILFDARTVNEEDGNKGKIRAIRQSPFYRMIDIFTTSERLSISLLEEITGERIKQGTVLFVNKTPGTSFTAMINNRTLEENTASITLVEGTYSIKVFDTTKGRKRILTQRITVKEGAPIRVEFEPAKAKAKKEKVFDKKNTIRTNVFGGNVLFDPDFPSETMDGDLALPVLSYTRLFSQYWGITVTVGFLSGPGNTDNYGNSLQSAGFEIMAGPHLRINRVGINLMGGYSLAFDSPDLNEYSLSDFFNREDTTGKTALFVQTALIVFGVDFFITPMFSIYGDIGFCVGTKEEYTENEYSSRLGFGLTLALGVGVSF